MLITWVPIITRAKNRTGQEEKQVALMETIQREILEERLEQEMSALAKEMYGKTIEETTDKELYYVQRFPRTERRRFIISPRNS